MNHFVFPVQIDPAWIGYLSVGHDHVYLRPKMLLVVTKRFRACTAEIDIGIHFHPVSPLDRPLWERSCLIILIASASNPIRSYKSRALLGFHYDNLLFEKGSSNPQVRGSGLE